MDSRLFALLQNIAQGFFIINQRLCICHADHRSKASLCGRGCSCMDILLIGQTRISEMHMNVYQTRRSHQAGSVNDLLILCLRSSSHTIRRADFSDDSILNYKICSAVCLSSRVQHPASLNKYHIPVSSFLFLQFIIPESILPDSEFPQSCFRNQPHREEP